VNVKCQARYKLYLKVGATLESLISCLKPPQERPGFSTVVAGACFRPGAAPLAHDNEVSYSVIMMIRTQISLSEAEYQAAKEEARRLGISLAELLRRSLRLTLPTDQSRPWMRYAGLIESGDTRSSQRIDDIVYGQKD